MIRSLFYRLSITHKIVSLLVGISTLSVIFATAAFTLFEYYSAREQAKQNVEFISQIVSENMIASVAFDDRKSIEQLLNMLKAEKNILYAEVRNANNALLASYGDYELIDNTDSEYSDNYLHLKKDLYLEEVYLGDFLIISNTYCIVSRIKVYLTVAVLVLCSSIIISLLLSVFLQKLLSQPILKLSKFANKIKDKGDYNLRVDINRDDEIGDLAKVFNQMLKHIENRDLKLEDDVAKRTIELISANKKLSQLAFHDNLTGLPNRVLLEDRMRQAVSKQHRQPSSISLLFIDMDKFKQVNDEFGHAIGDELLIDTAKQLISHCREEDTVARFGGDEFIMLLTLSENENVATVCHRIIKGFNQFVAQHRLKLDVTLSIGVANFGPHGTDFDTLKNYADQAMYQVKRNGRNGFIINSQHVPIDDHLAQSK